jgi:hypothetical protein
LYRHEISDFPSSLAFCSTYHTHIAFTHVPHSSFPETSIKEQGEKHIFIFKQVDLYLSIDNGISGDGT